MENKWRYGDSWEKYPIEEGEIWTDPKSGSMVSVHDIRDPLPQYMMGAEMIYCDPPWSKGNANSFITKAGKSSYIESFDEFVDALFDRILMIDPRICYLEIGKQHVENFSRLLCHLSFFTSRWPIKYYKKHQCFLLRGSQKEFSEMDFTGIDDEKTPLLAVQAEKPASVADLCTGRGLTMLAAHACGARFFGTELNKRRLAVAIERAAAIGVHYEKVPF